MSFSAQETARMIVSSYSSGDSAFSGASEKFDFSMWLLVSFSLRWWWWWEQFYDRSEVYVTNMVEVLDYRQHSAVLIS